MTDGPPSHIQVDYQCRRCGSSLDWEQCATCEATGDLDWVTALGRRNCPTCRGSGRMPTCLSTREYCDTHPLPGRDHIDRHTPEKFTIQEDQ